MSKVRTTITKKIFDTVKTLYSKGVCMADIMRFVGICEHSYRRIIKATTWEDFCEKRSERTAANKANIERKNRSHEDYEQIEIADAEPETIQKIQPFALDAVVNLLNEIALSEEATASQIRLMAKYFSGQMEGQQ